MAQMPQALQTALESELAGRDARQMERDAKAISERYRTKIGEGRRLLTERDEAAAYAAARMPATYAAAHEAIAQALACSGLTPATLLDVGAGTGAVSWAANALLELDAVTCMEREEAMRDVGKGLMQSGGEALARAQWISGDITKDALPGAELVIEGYMLGELAADARMAAARKIWDAAAKMAIFIEPGTPQGFANLACVRRELACLGAHVAAPCPANENCPMAGEDWCHFAVRVQRTKLHKALKGGDAPYEDEKFTYLALTREKPQAACCARVLRHPQIAPGRIGLTLCTAEGIVSRNITKKDPLWKRARKIAAGDAL